MVTHYVRAAVHVAIDYRISIDKAHNHIIYSVMSFLLSY